MTSGKYLKDVIYKNHILTFYKCGFGVGVEVFTMKTTCFCNITQGDGIFFDTAPTKLEALQKAKEYINK